MTQSLQCRRARFGDYVVDFRSGELFKHGIRVKIQDQPFQVLTALLDASGELVTRDELRKKLWSDDTFVDFERGLNAAIRRLRDALNDSADHPRYIETLPRHGYRFIGQVDQLPEPATAQILATTADTPVAAITADSPVSTETAPKIASSERNDAMRIRILVAAAGLILFIGLGYARWISRVSATYSTPHTPSLAVLPFDNLSGDASQDFFADGVTEAVTTNLAKIPGLRVISRTSAMKYRASHETLPQIARSLNVDAVVEGSVVRSGDRVRVSVKLIEAATDSHLWEQEYDSKIKDVLALQTDISTKVASEVKVNLPKELRAQLSKPQTVNPAAYEDYLKAKYFFSREDENGFQKAITYYQKSIELDPGFAPAYTGLAETYGFEAYTARANPEYWERSEKLLAKALQLDPDSSSAHALAGMIQFQFRCDRVGAEKELELALRLNPGDMSARDYYSYYLLEVGRFDEAITAKSEVVRNDPASVSTSAELGDYFLVAGRADEAIAQLQKAIELDPHFPPALMRLGLAYAHKQQYDLAIQEINKALTEERTPGRLANLGYVFAMAGRREEALQVLIELKEMEKKRYVEPADIARLYAYLGQKDEAFAWLDKIVKPGDDPMLDDQAFESLRADPRFEKLKARFKSRQTCPQF